MKTTRDDWICYICGTRGTRVQKRRVRINRFTTECLFLCTAHSGEYQRLVQEMRRLFSRKSPPRSSGYLGEGS